MWCEKGGRRDRQMCPQHTYNISSLRVCLQSAIEKYSAGQELREDILMGWGGGGAATAREIAVPHRAAVLGEISEKPFHSHMFFSICAVRHENWLYTMIVMKRIRRQDTRVQ